MVAIVEELHLPLLPGQVRAVLLEVVLHCTAAVLGILEPPVQLQHTVLLGHQVPPHLLQGRKTDTLCLHQSEQHPNTLLNVSLTQTDTNTLLNVSLTQTDANTLLNVSLTGQHWVWSGSLSDHARWERWSNEAPGKLGRKVAWTVP